MILAKVFKCQLLCELYLERPRAGKTQGSTGQPLPSMSSTNLSLQGSLAITLVAKMSWSRFLPSWVSSLKSRGSPTAMVVVGRPWYLIRSRTLGNIIFDYYNIFSNFYFTPAVQGMLSRQILNGDGLAGSERVISRFLSFSKCNISSYHSQFIRSFFIELI